MSDVQEYKDGENPDNNVVYTPPTPGGDPTPEDAQRIKDVGGKEPLPTDTPAAQAERERVAETRGVDPSEVHNTLPPDLSEHPEGPPHTRTAPEETIPGQPPTPEGEPPAGPSASPAPGTQP